MNKKLVKGVAVLLLVVMLIGFFGMLVIYFI